MGLGRSDTTQLRWEAGSSLAFGSGVLGALEGHTGFRV